MELLSALAETVWQLVTSAATLVVLLLALVLYNALFFFWLAFSLFAINWKKMWPTLAAGAWVPLTLIAVVIALAWSQLVPSACPIPGFTFLGNFWWQLGVVAFVAAATLFAGWLQGVLGVDPPEIEIEPAVAEDHSHGHH